MSGDTQEGQAAVEILGATAAAGSGRDHCIAAWSTPLSIAGAHVRAVQSFPIPAMPYYNEIAANHCKANGGMHAWPRTIRRL